MSAQAVAEATIAAMFAADRASQSYGMAYSGISPGRATVTMTVTDTMVNGQGACHGGVIFTLADTAFAFACNTHGRVTVSIENSITYPAAIHPGDVLTADAREEAASNRIGYYRVDVTNQRGETVALFRGTCYRTQRPIFPDAET